MPNRNLAETEGLQHRCPTAQRNLKFPLSGSVAEDQWGSFFKIFLPPRPHFSAPNADFLWSHDSKSHLIASNLKDPDTNVVCDDEFLVDLPTQNKHLNSSLKQNRRGMATTAIK